jgi:dihydroxyacetone kinase-like predicted kinase
MILSHFLLGFSESVGERASLSVAEFGESLRSATEHVYRALEKPVEGTIITIMSAIADESRRWGHTDFVVLFERLLVRAREALASTPDLLPVLKKAAWWTRAPRASCTCWRDLVVHGRRPARPLEEIPDYGREPTFAAGAAEYPTESERFRFCTEALVRGPSIPSAGRGEAVLRDRGDSLVVIRSENLLKIHVHTTSRRRSSPTCARWASWPRTRRRTCRRSTRWPSAPPRGAT